MLTTEEMIFRLIAAIVLGAIIGLERQLAGKDAGIRTDIMVSAGSALFAIVGLSLPHLVGSSAFVQDVIIQNAGYLNVIANIVVGVGFLGAGVIVKQGIHVRSLTTAATVWFVSAIGVLCGIGLVKFALISSIGLALLLLILRTFRAGNILNGPEEKPER